VAGEEEAKTDLHEVVDFLKNRTKYQAVGARIPRGILLVGPPGTGKTLLARAVAGEAGVPFFSAATNRPDVLDPALLRPGRFDHRVTLELPDIGERLAILKVHAAGKPLDKSIDLEIVARESHSFSGADLATLINEAAIMTARRNKTVIGMDEIEEAIDRIVAGPQKRSRKISQQEKRVAAYHEAGHALVARLLPNADPVHKISIIPRGGLGGFTRLLPTEEHYLLTRSQFKDTLATFLGGHAAEELIFHEVTTGPHSDLKQATDLARKMITEYGMSEKLPLRTFGGGEEEGVYYGIERRDYGEEVVKQIDEEVRSLIDTANSTAVHILAENKARLVHLAERLIVVETLEGPELEHLFTEPIPLDENEKIKSQKLEPAKAVGAGRVTQSSTASHPNEITSPGEPAAS
jgi:cell division protease FtsH